MTTLTAYDLTPAPRIRLRNQRRALARRINAVAGLAVSLVVLHTVATPLLTPASEPLEQTFDQHLEANALLTTSIAASSARLASATEQRGLIAEIGQQPDWGALLRLLAAAAQGDASLSSVAIVLATDETNAAAPERIPAPIKPEQATPHATARGPFILEIAGNVLEPGHAADLGLKLEDLGAFRNVVVLDTQRPQPGSPATFRIRCEIGNPPNRSTQTKAP
ncbi:MAG: hypothetical protein AAF108_07380 [Planctomycetota bacterium]